MTAKKKLERKTPQNPLDPEFRVPDESGNYYTIGAIDGSKVPKKYFKKNASEADSTLRTSDIARN